MPVQKDIKENQKSRCRTEHEQEKKVHSSETE